MRILRIEIEGFKSYGSLQTLERLDPQFNAITGLNGSGKSNVLDSICFLLGITQLHYIRADNTEDLIFKKGQGGVTKATVTITFDNNDPKHRPVGYEEEKQITVKRQLILNGKETYHINGIQASKKKVADLFNSCALNVNNPHFLIMQGRVTKVLNMKPREILFMVEEAAGVRIYETKKKIAISTMEKKEVKIQQINKMMDEEILPRLEKLRNERDQFNEYNKLGRDVENLQRMQICLDYWMADSGAKNMDEFIRNLISDHEVSHQRKRNLVEEIDEKIELLRVMQEKLDNELNNRRNELNEVLNQRESERTDGETNLNKKTEEITDMKTKIADAEANIKSDKERLKLKKRDLHAAQNKHGNEAQQFAEAQQQKERCMKTLNALDRGLITDEDGREVSMQQQLLDLRSKLNSEESKARVFQSRLDDLKPELSKKERELHAATSSRRSSSTGNLEKTASDLKKKIHAMEQKLSSLNVNDEERSTLNQQRYQLTTQKRQLEDKKRDVLNRYHLDLDYRPPRNFDVNEVIGTFAKLIRMRNPESAVALEVALGSILFNVIVRYKDTAKVLLRDGQLRKRTTFIPLDNVNSRLIDSRKFARAQELVGEDNVFRAIDLVEFDPEIQKAVEFALGGVLVCQDPEDAKLVCFDRQINTRVVTFDGDDYQPGGYLTGGARTQRSSILSDLHSMHNIGYEEAEIDAKIKEVDDRCRVLVNDRQEKEMLEIDVQRERVELSRIVNLIRDDPVGMLRERIDELKCEIEENTKKLAELTPTLDRMRQQVNALAEQQRNQEAYRNEERRKAEAGLRQAEATFERLKGDAAKGREQLSILQLDVETLEGSIKDDEKTCDELKSQLENLTADLQELRNQLNEVKKREEEARFAFEAATKDYRNQEAAIRRDDEYINTLKKTLRDLENDQKNFDKEHENAVKKQADLAKHARFVEQKNSWITEEKEHFNKPGTSYDFRTMTAESIRHDINAMKERRSELERRVNVNAMKSLTEEEQRVEELDSKRQTLKDDKRLLETTINEIDSEKQRELINAYKKISHDFGGIFSTILPGAQAKLEAIDPSDLTVGLQIRVGFNNKWKESLDELSGGQRSLVALSLILAMLKCNPAPIYILDEVDAALDVNHTTNIGTMIRQHFKESQFIIVSLKEGMFNNANVIYRTQFVNGVSVIRRTENRV
ncbi:Structural maintenance of chromosomes protein [Aphelenchoides besseyi]|nr:Structural maintenance of chromosomes protein [Aphelenchoides besseyi]KAI6199200.1 Structural maintenance of chromosomes protein [Aphelenchoides besseyi]